MSFIDLEPRKRRRLSTSYGLDISSSNLCGNTGVYFQNRSDRLWGPPNSLFDMYQSSFWRKTKKCCKLFPLFDFFLRFLSTDMLIDCYESIYNAKSNNVQQCSVL